MSAKPIKLTDEQAQRAAELKRSFVKAREDFRADVDRRWQAIVKEHEKDLLELYRDIAKGAGVDEKEVIGRELDLKYFEDHGVAFAAVVENKQQQQ